MNYQHPCDLLRAAELANRNERRRAAWDAKYARRAVEALRRIECGKAKVGDAAFSRRLMRRL